MKIIYDDIIYSLQRSGGISLYWSQLEKFIKQDVRLLYKNCNKNIFLPSFFEGQKIINDEMIFFERLKNVVLPEESPFIFHSSYYRFCKNKYVFNITTVHDFIHEYFRRDIKSVIFSKQKKYAIFHSAGIICNSENTKNDLLKFYPEYKGMTKVIYLGLSNDYSFLNLPRKNNVIFIGTRSGYKNFDFAVKLMQNIPELNLEIIGGGKITKQEYKFLQNTIPNRYKYYSSLTNNELNMKYNEAKFLLYPSLYEGFGVPVVEAQAAGCPVVCCCVSSLPEITGDAAVYISGKNIEDDLNKISQLSDPVYYKTLIEKGFENCKKFSWKKCAEETYNFYKEVYNLYTNGK